MFALGHYMKCQCPFYIIFTLFTQFSYYIFACPNSLLSASAYRSPPHSFFRSTPLSNSIPLPPPPITPQYLPPISYPRIPSPHAPAYLYLFRIAYNLSSLSRAGTYSPPSRFRTWLLPGVLSIPLLFSFPLMYISVSLLFLFPWI